MLVEFKKKINKKEEITATILASTPLIGFILFGLIPLALAMVMAFHYMPRATFEKAEFVWFENFSTVFNDKVFWRNMVNTFYMALSLPISLMLSLVVAFFLSKNIKFAKFFRTVFFIPYVCSVVATTTMWARIFNPDYGIVNIMLGRTGETAIQWLADPKLYIPTVIIISVWGGTGFGIILLSAALTNVNSTYIEAAKVDGAGPVKCFFSIVLPAITPTLFYLFTMGLIGSLQMYALTNMLVTASNNAGHAASGTMVSYIVDRVLGGRNRSMGVASAASWIVSAIIFVVIFINFRVGKKWVSYD